MTNVLVRDESYEIMNEVIKCLETKGFNIVITEYNVIKVDKSEVKPSENQQKEKLKPYQSIFPSIPKIKEVFEYIELNYREKIKLKEVAQVAGYSSAYLTGLVKKLSGKAVIDWIIERRIAEAKRLLLETEYCNEEIAANIGYNNVNHFYCQFRDYCNSTPNAWRQEQRRKLT
ncbi:MAG: AraC family transcriptional regulator [Cyanobacteria bacterium J06643_5]